MCIRDRTGNSNTGATSVTRDTVVTCGIPTTFGAGVTYVYDNRLTDNRIVKESAADTTSKDAVQIEKDLMR